MLNESLVALHHDYAPLLTQAEASLRSEVEKVARAFGAEVQLISSRCKSPTSLRRKLARPDKTYATLWQITDLLGIRIITYFERTVEALGAALENALPVDFLHSSNKLNAIDAMQFGYRSLHYVCALSSHQQSLTGLPADFRYEIQVRTVLQHAWAEIEHDLGYKANDTIPPAIRRRFSRVASLLEVADEEFDSIRTALSDYARQVQEQRSETEGALPLDRISLQALVECPEVQEHDRLIATILGKRLSDEPFFPEYLLKMLALVGINTVSDCLLGLKQHGPLLQASVLRYFEFAQETWKVNAAQIVNIESGYSLFFVAQIALLKRACHEAIVLNGITMIARFYQALDYPEEPKTATAVAEGLYRAMIPLFAPLSHQR